MTFKKFPCLYKLLSSLFVGMVKNVLFGRSLVFNIFFVTFHSYTLNHAQAPPKMQAANEQPSQYSNAVMLQYLQRKWLRVAL
jgi:hypothetical protein